MKNRLFVFAIHYLLTESKENLPINKKNNYQTERIPKSLKSRKNKKRVL